VIDAAANCTAMVHLPVKRALFCIIKNAVTIARCSIGTPARQQRQLQTLSSMPARRAVVKEPYRAESEINRRNFALAFGASCAMRDV
jgi:hypothetical protein